MADTLQALAGFALIIGLFVAYFVQRRARTSPAASPAPVEEVTTARDTAEGRATGSSPVWGMPIVFCALLMGAATHRGSWWGYLWQAFYLAIVVVAIHSALSPKEFAAEQVRRPETTRRDHVMQLGVPYAFVPVVAWVLAIPFGWTPAALLPALPWAVLLVIAMATVASDFVRRSLGRRR